MEFYGFDISEYQGVINWNRIPDKYSFVMIRAGYGVTPSQIDAKFNDNMRGALDRGLHVGVYWFLYALTVDDAIKNARALLEVIEPYKGKIDYPLVLDVEGDTIRYMSGQGKEASKRLITDMVDAFCTEIEQAGYYAMVYSDNSFINTYFYSDILNRYDLWFAYWVNIFNPDYCIRPCGMWQYTNAGNVDGISGRVDMDFTEIDYPELMKLRNLNHVIPVETPVKKSKIVVSGYVTEDDDKIVIVLDKNKVV